MSGKARRMGAALPGYISKDNGANPNMIQYGDKLQGLASVTNMRSGVTRHVKTRAWGSTRDRHRIFCINQLGGVGNVKNSQFAPNADGVMECHNRKNTRDKWDGIYHRSFGESQLLSNTQHDAGLVASYAAWNFMASNDLLVEEVLSSLPTGNITGTYFNSFRCLYSDWDSESSTEKGQVNCDGEIVDTPDSTSCTDVKRMSNFFYNSEAEAYTKDLYLGFSQSNYIETVQPQASSSQAKATLGKNLQHLGYDSDKMIVWFCFGGDAASQAINPDTGNGSKNNIKDIIDVNNETLSKVPINNKHIPYIKGLNFDVEGGILTAAQTATPDPQSGVSSYNYFKDLLTYLNTPAGKPDSGKIEYIQFTILVGNASPVPEFKAINNALAAHHSNFKFRISFMPYANGSIITNCGACGAKGDQKGDSQDGCVCYYANTLAGANMLIGGGERCEGFDCADPSQEPYRDSSGNAFSCCKIVGKEFDSILGSYDDSGEICPAYAPYPYSGKQAGQPSSPQPAWCCADFTNPTSTGCGGAHVKCDPENKEEWFTCETYTSTCPASHPYPYNGKTAGQPSPEEVPQAWCCAEETDPTSGVCGGAHVKCDPDSKGVWVTCKEYDPPGPGPGPGPDPGPNPDPKPVHTGSSGVCESMDDPCTNPKSLCNGGLCDLNTIIQQNSWALLAAYYGIPLVGAISTALENQTNSTSTDTMKKRILYEEAIIQGIYKVLRKYIPSLITGKGKKSDGVTADNRYDMWLAQSALVGTASTGCPAHPAGIPCSCYDPCQGTNATQCGQLSPDSGCPGGPGAQCSNNSHCIFEEFECSKDEAQVKTTGSPGTCIRIDQSSGTNTCGDLPCSLKNGVPRHCAYEDRAGLPTPYGKGPYVPPGSVFPSFCNSPACQGRCE